MDNSLPDIHALWIGNKLGPIHAACLRSFIRMGHRVVLHCYEGIVDLPSDISLFDASQIMPPDEIFSHKRTGSLAIASDIYRLRILARGMGVYVDCDVYAVSPIHDEEYIFGWDSDILDDKSFGRSHHEPLGLINGAVLKMPASSPLLEKMLTIAEDPYFIPWWEGKKRVRKLKLRKTFGIPEHVGKQSWGVIGPYALTHSVIELGLLDLVKPSDIFYYYRPSHKALLNTPGLSVSDLLTPRSKCLHLCSSGGIPAQIADNSPLSEMLQI